MTATVQVTNTGNIRKDYFLDPRLNGRVPQLLFGTGTNNVSLPLSFTQQPIWLVPPGTNSLTMFAQGNVPIVLESSANFGNPTRSGRRSATPR